jgi:hypothetical protein
VSLGGACNATIALLNAQPDDPTLSIATVEHLIDHAGGGDNGVAAVLLYDQICGAIDVEIRG